MAIICGKKELRTKRGVTEERSSVNIGFNLETVKLGDDPRKDCPRICLALKIPNRFCDKVCVSAYKR